VQKIKRRIRRFESSPKKKKPFSFTIVLFVKTWLEKIVIGLVTFHLIYTVMHCYPYFDNHSFGIYSSYQFGP